MKSLPLETTRILTQAYLKQLQPSLNKPQHLLSSSWLHEQLEALHSLKPMHIKARDREDFTRIQLKIAGILLDRQGSTDQRGAEYDTPHNSPGDWEDMEDLEDMHDFTTRAGIEAFDFNDACGDR